MNSNDLLDELEEEFLPKLPSVEGGWRLLFDRYGTQLLAQISTRLIHLAFRQQSRIEKLEDEIAELKKRLAHEE